jgi:hypothetical protein
MQQQLGRGITQSKLLAKADQALLPEEPLLYHPGMKEPYHIIFATQSSLQGTEYLAVYLALAQA